MPSKQQPERKPQESNPEQRALGQRFKTLREVAGLTQDQAAEKLAVTKGGLSAWETGRNMPNPFMLRKMAKLYKVSVDALLWDDSLSPEAMKFAAQYDNLSGKQRGIFESLWLAYFERSVADEDVEAKFEATNTAAKAVSKVVTELHSGRPSEGGGLRKTAEQKRRAAKRGHTKQ